MSIRAKDIAKKLGVSTTTVSLVLNNKPGVGEKTRKRVLKEIESLGFETNIKIKPTASLKNIRIIIFKGHGLVVGDTPFFSKLLESIEGESRINGFNIIISYLNKDTNTSAYIKQFEDDGTTAGILLLATEMKEEDISPFSNLSLPVLVLDNCFNSLQIDNVQIDNIEGTTQAVNHFAVCGHTDIGYLHSSADIFNFGQRYKGFKAALVENGLEFHSDEVIKLEPTVEGSHRDMKKYLKSNGKLPKALFADNDILALGASRALKEEGYKLPEDVSIIGFDDMPYCVMMRPKLTTVSVSNAGMGIVAVKRLADIINGKTIEKVKILIRTNFVIRNSVREM